MASPASTKARRSCSLPTSASTRSRRRPRRRSNPQRNLPIGILGGLAICTVIYVVVGAVITGMVPYTELGVADPLARALELIGYSGVGAIVAFGAVISMSAVLLVFQYGQPRIFFAMARDGLLPEWVARIDPKTRIPYTATLVTGILVAVASMIGDAAETYDLTNVGTLFAFALVCAGVLVLRVKEPDRRVRSRCRSSGLLLRSASPPACSSWSACRTRPGSASASGSSIGIDLYAALRLQAQQAPQVV